MNEETLRQNLTHVRETLATAAASGGYATPRLIAVTKTHPAEAILPLAGMGITAQVVSGVPSFCAAAARLGVPLALGDESLHVVPAAYTDSLPGWPGTRVLMKSGRKLSRIKAQLKEHPGVALAVENCGLPGERVWRNADEIPEDAGYLTLLLLLPDRETER